MNTPESRSVKQTAHSYHTLQKSKGNRKQATKHPVNKDKSRNPHLDKESSQTQLPWHDGVISPQIPKADKSPHKSHREYPHITETQEKGLKTNYTKM